MTEWQGRKREPITEERLVKAVAVLAEIVEEHGPAYGPLYESVMQELEEFRQRQQSLQEQAKPQRSRKARKAA